MYNIPRDQVGAQHLNASGIRFGDEKNECTNQSYTSHFPEVSNYKCALPRAKANSLSLSVNVP